MLKKLLKSKKGFTLIEMIIVITILGILAVLVVPRLMAYSEKARIAADQTMARSIANACALYITENGQVDDTGDDLLELVAGYGLLDDDIVSQTAIEGKFQSNKYKGAVVTNNSTTGQITVRLQLVKGTNNDDDFIVTE